MIKENYKDRIDNLYDSVLDEIKGYHEVGHVLSCLSEYIDSCIQLGVDIYEDRDISYQSYMELNEYINNNLKEVCRVIKNS